MSVVVRDCFAAPGMEFELTILLGSLIDYGLRPTSRIKQLLHVVLWEVVCIRSCFGFGRQFCYVISRVGVLH